MNGLVKITKVQAFFNSFPMINIRYPKDGATPMSFSIMNFLIKSIGTMKGNTTSQANSSNTIVTSQS